MIHFAFHNKINNNNLRLLPDARASTMTHACLELRTDSKTTRVDSKMLDSPSARLSDRS